MTRIILQTSLSPDSHIMSSLRVNLKAALWIRELTQVAWSSISIVCMFTVLYECDGKPWPLSFITPNALLAILATVAVSCLHSPAGTALAQLGWLHYRTPHSLRELDIYHHAAQGSAGPLRLIRLEKGCGWGSLGAVVTFALLASQPTVQQTIRYYAHPVIDGLPATLSICTFYNSTSTGVAKEVPNPAQSMIDAIRDGQINPATLIFQPKPVCPTGNCTFNPIETLAFHSRCVQIDTSIRKHYLPGYGQSNCTYTLPEDGPSLSQLDSLFNMSASIVNSAAHYDGSRIFLNIPQQIVTVKAISRQQDRAVAQQCIIYPSVDRIRVSVTNGISLEMTTSSWYNNTPITPNQSSWIFNPPDMADGPFEMSWDAVVAIQNYLLNWYSGYITGGSDQATYSDGADTTTMQKAYTAMQTNMLATHFANVAQVMSYAAREWQTSNSERRSSANTAYGSSTRDKQYVHVEWLWILPIVILWLFSVIFLVCVMWLTAKHDIGPFATSIVAVMLAGPQGEDRSRLGKLSNSSQVPEAVADTEYQLQDVELGLRFGLPEIEPST